MNPKHEERLRAAERADEEDQSLEEGIQANQERWEDPNLTPLTHNSSVTTQVQPDQVIAPASQQSAGKVLLRVEVTFDELGVTTDSTSDEVQISFLRRLYGFDEATAIAWKEEVVAFQGGDWAIRKEEVTLGYRTVYVEVTGQQFTNYIARETIVSNKRDATGRRVGSDQRVQAYQELPRYLQNRIAVEARKRLVARTGKKIKQAGDRNTLEVLLQDTVDEILLEREALQNLSPAIKEVLSHKDGSVLHPKDYHQALTVAQKLEKLSPEQLQDFKNRGTGTTDDLKVLETQVDRYIAKLEQRQKAAVERKVVEGRLVGLEQLYQMFVKYQEMQQTVENQRYDEFGHEAPTRAYARGVEEYGQSLTAKLQINGFDSIATFAEAIEAYEVAFEQETAAIGQDWLDYYEHYLYEQSSKYDSIKKIKKFHQQIGESGARESFAQAYQYERVASKYERTPALDLHFDNKSKAETARLQGRTQLKEILEANSLFATENTTALQELSLASRKKFRRLIEEKFEEKRDGIAETRQQLAKDPRIVYRLDQLLVHAYQMQGIADNSIFDLIIKNKRDRLVKQEIGSRIAIAVFSVMFGVLGAYVTGLAGLGVAAGALGLSIYDVIGEFEQYSKMHAAHEVGLLAKDPSFAWVVIAVLGATFDFVEILKVLKHIRKPVSNFNKFGKGEGDIITLEKELKAIPEVEEGLRSDILRNARKKLDLDEAIESFNKIDTTIPSDLVSDLGAYTGMITEMADRSLKAGITKFEDFLDVLRANKILNKLDDLGIKGEEQFKLLKEAFENVQKLSTKAEVLAKLDPKLHKALEADFAARPALLKSFLQNPELVEAWKVLKNNPRLRKSIANLETIVSVLNKFVYKGKTGRTALEEIFTGHKSAQKFIDNLAKAEALFDGVGVKHWSGIKSSSEVRLVNDKGVVIGKVDNGTFTMMIDKGARPAPSTYLSFSYVDNHLAKFTNEGVGSRILLKKTHDKYGVGKPDVGKTEFISLKSDMDRLIAKSKGDIKEIAKSLGIDESQLAGGSLVRIDFKFSSKHKPYIPTGNEFGANDKWIPGGRLPDGDLEVIVETEKMVKDIDYIVTDLATGKIL